MATKGGRIDFLFLTPPYPASGSATVLVRFTIIAIVNLDLSIFFLFNDKLVGIGGSKGAPGTRSPGVQILSFSCSFQQKFEKY